MGLRGLLKKGGKGQNKKELGSKSLAYMSRVVRGTIRIVGVDVARKQVIKGIEGDIERATKSKDASVAIEKLIQDALNTPDYMELLKELDMGEEHLRVLAKQVQEKGEVINDSQ